MAWEHRLQDAQDSLKDAEGRLLLEGFIDGKNAECRAAQLRDATRDEREAVLKAECERDNRRIVFHQLTNELSALRAVARLLAAQE